MFDELDTVHEKSKFMREIMNMDTETLKIAFESLMYDFEKIANNESEFLENIRQNIESKICDNRKNNDNRFKQIINIANCISDGRKTDNIALSESDKSKRIKLYPIFTQLRAYDKKENDEKRSDRYYPIKPLSPSDIFPVKNDNPQNTDKQYKKLFADFNESIKNLKNENNPEFLFERFENFMMIFTSSIPYKTGSDDNSDIPLYEHAKTTSAVASALYLYHKKNGFQQTAITVYDQKNFCL